MVAVGQVLNIMALDYATVVLLSATSCFTLIFNSMLAPYFLGEKFEWKSDGTTIAILIIGSSMCLSQEPEDERTFKCIDELYGILLSPISIAVTILLVLFHLFSKWFYLNLIKDLFESHQMIVGIETTPELKSA